MSDRRYRLAAQRARLVVVLVLALLVGLALAACGGPDPEEEMAAIEEVAIGYGESEGAAACDFLSASALDQLGGESGCMREFESVPAAEFDVLEVTVEEETGAATVKNVESEMDVDLEFVKEDEEWKISSFPGLDQIAPPAGEAPTDELLAPPGEGGLAPPGPEAPPPAGGTQTTP
ncbi:MAG: hypothetical protein ACR2IN_07060 [Thermoleophilaceae bacterium]